MKKIILVLGIILAGLSVKSQCSIGLSPNTPGAYPAALNDGCVGSAYDETTTLVFPVDTTVNIPGPTTIPLDSVIITSVANVPSGLVAQYFCGSSPCTAYPPAPGSPAKTCIRLIGTPSAPFLNDSIEVMFTLYVTVFGSPQPFPSSKKVGITINSIDNTTSLSGLTITANETGATYRWLDCNNSSIAIPSETGVSYTATTSGSYAVEVSKNGCIDTSACETVATVGVIENSFHDAISLYPNPTNGIINLNLDKVYQNITIRVTDITGKSILNKVYPNSENLNFNIDGTHGIYFVEVSSNTEKAIFKVIKK